MVNLKRRIRRLERRAEIRARWKAILETIALREKVAHEREEQWLQGQGREPAPDPWRNRDL